MKEMEEVDVLSLRLYNERLSVVGDTISTIKMLIESRLCTTSHEWDGNPWSSDGLTDAATTHMFNALKHIEKAMCAQIDASWKAERKLVDEIQKLIDNTNKGAGGDE